METWRQLPGFDYDYEVSDLGSVRSWINKQGNRQAVPRLLKLAVDAHGYARCQLRMNRTNKKVRVHRLVLLVFVGSSPLQANHRNGNKQDNRLENLEYVTPRENCIHAVEVLGRHGGQSGEKHHNAKLTDAQVVEVRHLSTSGMTQRAIARHFKVSQSNVSDILHGRTRRGM